ncbi:MAG: GDSL-type esterase/lipase family protein [Candidatus Muirbacterium halophilum]|nr:GDSL-type esterase/lipase family protein [Candidatus Muirbacterium halophilum]MCK9476469.1 GDSL-type esterase/lipase family protein [Candidatus Muirbacterium halophilum]
MKKLIFRIFLILLSFLVIEVFFKKIHIKPNVIVDLNKKNILCIGDSFTIGYGVSSDKSYPSILQNLINEDKKDYNVINLGENGANSRKILLNLRNFLKNNKADIAIIQAGASNNWNLNYYTKDEIGFKQSILSKSSILNFFKILLKNNKDKDIEIILPKNKNNSILQNPFEKTSTKINKYIKIGDWENVELEFEKTGYSDENDYFFHFFACIENKKIKKAQNILNNNNFPKHYKELAKGILKIIENELKTALEHFKKFRELNPQNIFSYISIAYLYIESGHYDISEIWLSELIRIKPNSGVAYHILAELHYNFLNNQSKALDILKSGILKAPNYYENYVLLYDICEKHSPQTALPIIQSAIKIFGSDNDLKYYEEILKQNINLKQTYNELLKDNSLTNEEKAYFYLNSFQYKKAAIYFKKAGKQNQKELSLKLSQRTDSSTLYEFLIYKDIFDCIDILKKQKIKTFILGYPEQKISQIESVAFDKKIEFIDLFSEFIHLRKDNKLREQYILKDNHCTEKGNILTAKKVYKTLKTLEDF